MARRVSRALAGALAACAVLLSGCGDGAPREGAEIGDVAAPSLASRDARLLRLYAQGGIPRADACGARPASAEPRAILVAGGRQCMSCLNVGFAARRLQQAFARSPQPLWILTSNGDSSAVCAFVRAERLRVPVVAVPDSLFRTAATGDSLSLALFDEEDRSYRIVHARDGLELLSLASPGAATPSPEP